MSASGPIQTPEAAIQQIQDILLDYYKDNLTKPTTTWRDTALAAYNIFRNHIQNEQNKINKKKRAPFTLDEIRIHVATKIIPRFNIKILSLFERFNIDLSPLGIKTTGYSTLRESLEKAITDWLEPPLTQDPAHAVKVSALERNFAELRLAVRSTAAAPAVSSTFAAAPSPTDPKAKRRSLPN